MTHIIVFIIGALIAVMIILEVINATEKPKEQRTDNNRRVLLDRRINAGRIEDRKIRNFKIKNTHVLFVMLAYFIIIMSCMLFLSNVCHAENCQDPNTLSPQLKKAYYELKKASKELGGFSVSIKCYEKRSN